VADIDCSQYKVGNLAITELEDNDIENMMEVVYVSFINPASGKAFSVAGSNCVTDAKVTLRTYNQKDDYQKFKLINSGDGIFIQSKGCAGKSAEFLAVPDCVKDKPEVSLQKSLE
jgi:hypothetical protein